MSSFRQVNDLLSGWFATLSKQPGTAWRGSSRYRQQVSDSDQIVSGGSELEDPTDQLQASVSSLAQQSYGLQPTENLFHSFAFPLTDFITRMASCSLIDSTAAASSLVLRYVRRHSSLPQVADESLGVISFVGRQRHPLGSFTQQHQRRFAFRRAAGPRQLRIDHQAVAIFHQYVSLMSQFCFAALGLLKQSQIAVGSLL